MFTFSVIFHRPWFPFLNISLVLVLFQLPLQDVSNDRNILNERRAGGADPEDDPVARGERENDREEHIRGV